MPYRQRRGRQVVALGIHPGIAPGRAPRDRGRSERLEQHEFSGDHAEVYGTTLVGGKYSYGFRATLQWLAALDGD